MANPDSTPTFNGRQAHADYLRAKLYGSGYYPTQTGERMARRAAKQNRADVADRLTRLDPEDVLCLWVLCSLLENTQAKGWQERTTDSPQ